MNVLDIFIKKKLYLLVIYFIIGYILYTLIKKVINKKKLHTKRQKTIRELILGIIKYIIIVLVLVSSLSLIGVDVTSFLTGIGIAGIIVGLALQDVMKDILSGIFIITEDQFNVGDLIEVNGFTGEVVSIDLKSTKIKNDEGKLKIIANRDILEVINYSFYNNFASIKVPLSYELSNKEINNILNKVCKRIEKEIEVKGPCKVLGIDEFASSAIIYSLLVEIPSGMIANTKRKMREIVKDEFDKNNISIPYDKIEVLNGK